MRTSRRPLLSRRPQPLREGLVRLVAVLLLLASYVASGSGEWTAKLVVRWLDGGPR